VIRVPVGAVTEIRAFIESRRRKPSNVELNAALSRHEVRLPAPVAINCKIPLFSSKVAAGFPSPADDYIDKWLDLNELLVPEKESTFFVRVKGESMLEANIHPGDLLIVDRSREAKDGDIVIAVLDGELTVKRLSLIGGAVSLVPANPMFPVIVLKEGQELMVWGIVTHSVHAHS
jgi:DNA polymerase V